MKDLMCGYEYEDFDVLEYWENDPDKVRGLHARVSGFGDRVTLLGPPGAEPDWPSAEAFKRWRSRSVDSLIGVGMKEDKAEELVDQVFA